MGIFEHRGELIGELGLLLLLTRGWGKGDKWLLALPSPTHDTHVTETEQKEIVKHTTQCKQEPLKTVFQQSTSTYPH